MAAVTVFSDFGAQENRHIYEVVAWEWGLYSEGKPERPQKESKFDMSSPPPQPHTHR